MQAISGVKANWGSTIAPSLPPRGTWGVGLCVMMDDWGGVGLGVRVGVGDDYGDLKLLRRADHGDYQQLDPTVVSVLRETSSALAAAPAVTTSAHNHSTHTRHDRGRPLLLGTQPNAQHKPCRV